MPLPALAGEVQIFMVRDGAERVNPEEAAEYLSRHGVHPSIKVVEDGVRAADAAIGEEYAQWRPDYLLMGAYGRGRLRETFGGVTKRMLGKAALPIILGH